MERHIPHFQEELALLKTRLLEMGGLAEDRVRMAVRALVDRDYATVEKVLVSDEAINRLHIEIDDRCFKLLALHQPMAVDLRAIVSAVKINTDLERVGDLAINIAEAVGRYLQHPSVKELIDIPRMAVIAQGMLRDALDSFVRRDLRSRKPCSIETMNWTRSRRRSSATSSTTCSVTRPRSNRAWISSSSPATSSASATTPRTSPKT